jgi:hypothetical protein
MSSSNINWYKFVGNAGIAFFTTLSGMLSVEALTATILPLNITVAVAFVSAGIQGGLSFCKELSTVESKKTVKKKGYVNNPLSHRLLDIITFW